MRDRYNRLRRAGFTDAQAAALALAGYDVVGYVAAAPIRWVAS